MEKSSEKEICTFIEELEANLLVPHRIEDPELAEELFQVAKKNHQKAVLCNCGSEAWIACGKAAKKTLRWMLKDSLKSHTQAILRIGDALDQLEGKISKPKK